MLTNPYTPGETPPPALVGRDGELQHIARMLSRVVDDGEAAGGLLVFTAPRGIGKTSLLRVAAAEAQQRGLVTVWVSCVRQAPFLTDLEASLAQAMAELDYSGETAGIDSYQVEVGFAGAKVGATVKTADRADAGRQPGLVHAVEHTLGQAARAVRGHGGAGVVVFLDELHAPDLRDTGVFLNAVQNLVGDRSRNPVAFVGAGLPSTPGHLTRAATFGERSTFVPLERLPDRAALHAVVDPASAVGVLWAADAVSTIENAARGIPYFLQLLGSATWEKAAPNRGDTITLDHVRAGTDIVRRQVAAMFGARWDAATSAEQDFMEAMAVAMASGQESVSRGDIATTLGRSSRELSVPRARLIDKGIIEATGHGRLAFTLPGFARFVSAQTGGTLDSWEPLPLPRA